MTEKNLIKGNSSSRVNNYKIKAKKYLLKLTKSQDFSGFINRLSQRIYNKIKIQTNETNLIDCAGRSPRSLSGKGSTHQDLLQPSQTKLSLKPVPSSRWYHR